MIPEQETDLSRLALVVMIPRSGRAFHSALLKAALR